MVWMRNKKSGEMRQVRADAGAWEDHERVVRDNQIRAGLVDPRPAKVEPGMDDEARAAELSRAAYERDLWMKGLEKKMGNTMLSGKERAAAGDELGRMLMADRQAASAQERARFADRKAGTAVKVAEAEAAGKAAARNPVFELPGGKKGMLVGDVLVDAENPAQVLADGRKDMFSGAGGDEVFSSAEEARRAGKKSGDVVMINGKLQTLS
jgi:hypothetical protein